MLDWLFKTSIHFMWFFYTTKTLDADKLAYHLPNSFLLFFSSRTRLCFALEISHLYTRWTAWIRHQLLCLWRFIYLCISHTLNRSLIDERNKTIKKNGQRILYGPHLKYKIFWDFSFSPSKLWWLTRTVKHKS